MRHGLARKIDPALLVNFQDLDFNLFAFFDNILSFFDEMVGQLVHPDKAFLAGKNSNKYADSHDAGDFAFVNLADFGFDGEPLNLFPRSLNGYGVGGRDINFAVVFDFDFRTGFFNNPADVLPARTNESSDLLHRDLER